MDDLGHVCVLSGISGISVGSEFGIGTFWCARKRYWNTTKLEPLVPTQFIMTNNKQQSKTKATRPLLLYKLYYTAIYTILYTTLHTTHYTVLYLQQTSSDCDAGSDAGSAPLKTQATTVVVDAKAALLQRSRRTINAPSLSLALARAPARPPTPTHWD